MNLTGKIALVTGGSRGIGAAIVRLLAARGASVAFTFRSRGDLAAELVAEIGATGATARSYQADLSDAGSIGDLARSVAADFGRIDILVNNAGVFILRSLEEADEQAFEELFRTNVLGPLLLMQACLPHLPERGGRVINVLSTLAVAPFEVASLYGATKAALRALTQGYVGEFARRGATINAVAPGVVMTDMMEGAPEDALQKLAEETAAGRLGQPEDIAPLVAFLASDDSAWMTGRTLIADGGRIIA